MRTKKPHSGDFKKGVSGNPYGRPKVLPILKEAREINRETFTVVLSKYLHFTIDELQTVIQDPFTPAVDVMVCRIIVKGARYGEHQWTTLLLDRLIGKVKDVVDVNAKLAASAFAQVHMYLPEKEPIVIPPRDPAPTRPADEVP